MEVAPVMLVTVLVGTLVVIVKQEILLLLLMFRIQAMFPLIRGTITTMSVTPLPTWSSTSDKPPTQEIVIYMLEQDSHLQELITMQVMFKLQLTSA
jgi:hypothetical protein